MTTKVEPKTVPSEGTEVKVKYSEGSDILFGLLLLLLLMLLLLLLLLLILIFISFSALAFF